jgi:hypothetical protein
VDTFTYRPVPIESSCPNPLVKIGSGGVVDIVLTTLVILV